MNPMKPPSDFDFGDRVQTTGNTVGYASPQLQPGAVGTIRGFFYGGPGGDVPSADVEIDGYPHVDIFGTGTAGWAFALADLVKAEDAR